MNEKKRTLAVRLVLGVLMAVVGAGMLAGCPVSTTQQHFEPQAAISPANF
jgi:hypothetical protein